MLTGRRADAGHRTAWLTFAILTALGGNKGLQLSDCDPYRQRGRDDPNTMRVPAKTFVRGLAAMLGAGRK